MHFMDIFCFGYMTKKAAINAVCLPLLPGSMAHLLGSSIDEQDCTLLVDLSLAVILQLQQFAARLQLTHIEETVADEVVRTWRIKQ